MDPPEQVEAPAVPAVGVVWLLVILKTIDPVVVVHVNSEQEFGTVGAEPQKRLLVVGDGIGLSPIVVLVEVGDEIVVAIPAGKNAKVDGTQFRGKGIGRALGYGVEAE